MRYSKAIERKIIEQLIAEPERDTILPSWAYASGNQPVIYHGGKPVKLARHLYEKIVGPIPDGAGLKLEPGHDPRDVNPHHFVVTGSPHVRLTCPNNHRYTDQDRTEDGYRCHVCREEKNLGTPSVSDVNAAKTHCPKNHVLVLRTNGRRRCMECPREQQARYRVRQKEKA